MHPYLYKVNTIGEELEQVNDDDGREQEGSTDLGYKVAKGKYVYCVHRLLL